MPAPSLVLITGPPGSGKSSLARRIADALDWQLVSRDAIATAQAAERDWPGPGSQANLRANEAFFAEIRSLLSEGTEVVAEAAFQHLLWSAGLAGLPPSSIRLVRCAVAPDVAQARVARRLAENPRERAAHQDSAYITGEARAFEALELHVPTVIVDTRDGYRPPLPEIVAAVGRHSRAVGTSG